MVSLNSTRFSLCLGKVFSVKKTFSFFAVLCLFFGALFFDSCKMDDDTDNSIEGLDANLTGTWKMDSVGWGGEKIVIVNAKSGASYEHYSVAHGTGEETLRFGGYIRYAKQFTQDTGVIIIEYAAGKEQEWSTWADDGTGTWVPSPVERTGNFYGIYYHNLKRVPERDNRWEVFLANTTDLNNNFAPTETTSLSLAIEHFTEANIRNYIDLSAGDPQYRDN